jgi:hypothetical protein
LNPRIKIILETVSNSHTQHNDAVCEISVETFTQIMRKDFNIFSEPVPGKAYGVRYTNEPSAQSKDERKSIQVFTHNKGTMLGPLVITSILTKFEIDEASYLEAMSQEQLQKIRPKSDKLQ